APLERPDDPNPPVRTGRRASRGHAAWGVAGGRALETAGLAAGSGPWSSLRSVRVARRRLASANAHLFGGTRSFRAFASTIEANSHRPPSVSLIRAFAPIVEANSRLFAGARTFREFADTQPAPHAGDSPQLADDQ